MTQLMLPLVILPDDTQHAHGSDDGMCQNLFEDDGRVQTLDKDGVSEGFDCSLSTTKVLEGSLCVPDKILSGLHMKNDGGGKIATKRLVDAVVGHSLPLECENSLPLPSPTLRCDDADGVAELPLPSLLTSPNDYYLTGHMGGVSELSPTKCHNDNNLTSSLPSSSKCSDENNKGDTSMVSELFLPPFTKRRDDNKSVGDADVVNELPLTSVMNSLENVTQAIEGLSQLSLPSPQKSNNANSLRGNLLERVAELQSKPSTKSHVVNGLQSAVVEDLIVFQQDEQVQALEEGELSERLSDDECLEMSEDVMTHGEGESHLLNDNPVESKTFESSSDDEMNQPISLFISRYRSRSSVNPSARKMPPLDTDSNIKTKVKTGHKRKVEEQEQLLKELISTDMAGKVQLKQAKGGQKRPSKVARVLNNNGGGLSGVASKVSAVSKISMGEAKDDGENQYAKLAATRARRDQVMGTPAVALCEKEDGASCPHSKGLTQHGLERSKHDFAPEKRKVCLPMVVEEGLSTVDAGNDHNSSQAEVATTKPKRILTAERKKKRQRKRHKKAYERRVGKIRVKPCIKKQTEKKPCHFYARGRCDKGVSCPFLHDITPITKSEICKYFINNCCLKGDDCPYSHALSTFPCKYFHTRGKCMEADSCQFSHEPISKEAKQKLLTKIEQEQVHEGNKATDRNSLGCIHPKYSVLPSDLELFPLGGKRGNRTPLKVTDAAASKMPHLDKIGTGSMSNTISKIPMLVAAKKAASTFIGGDTRVNAANLEMNKSMLHGSLLDPTGFLADKSSAIRTTKSAPRETGLPLVQTTVLSRDSTTTQERKIKIDAFLQEQLNTSHLMRKPTKLGMGSESSGGCFMLLNQPRAMSMGQTSLLKAPNTSASRDRNAKAMMGSPHASVDHSHLTPTSKPTICAGNKPKSDFSIDQGKGFPNEESVGIDASVPNPSVLGPSLLDLVSTPQRATFPKGPTASTSGLLSPTIDATSKEVQPVLFWIGF